MFLVSRFLQFSGFDWHEGLLVKTLELKIVNHVRKYLVEDEEEANEAQCLRWTVRHQLLKFISAGNIQIRSELWQICDGLLLLLVTQEQIKITPRFRHIMSIITSCIHSLYNVHHANVLNILVCAHCCSNSLPLPIYTVTVHINFS